MTDAQLVDLYAVERQPGPEGLPKFAPPVDDAPRPGPRAMFARKCYLLGITDPDAVAALWAAERRKWEG